MGYVLNLAHRNKVSVLSCYCSIDPNQYQLWYRYYQCKFCVCVCVCGVLTHDECESPVPPLWPPGGLSSAFSPPVILSLSTLLFLHLTNCFRASTTRCGLCTCIHAQHAGKYSHAHTPLCLYLIIGSVTEDIFPDNACEGGEPGRPNERGRSLYPSSHGSLGTGTPTDWDEWI